MLAAELGEQKIRVNCLLPGAVFTEINQRAGLMDDETALQRLEGMSDLHALAGSAPQKKLQKPWLT